MLGHPTKTYAVTALPPCPCDKRSIQNDLQLYFFVHFILMKEKDTLSEKWILNNVVQPYIISSHCLIPLHVSVWPPFFYPL